MSKMEVADIVTKEVLKKAMTMVDTDKMAKVAAVALEKNLMMEIKSLAESYEFSDDVYDRVMDPLLDHLIADMLKKLGLPPEKARKGR